MTGRQEPEIDQARPSNIWLYKQNKPTLIVRDLAKVGVSEHFAYTVLMARGVFKWLAVRRDLIKLKVTWKGRLNRTLGSLQRLRSGLVPDTDNPLIGNYHYIRGYRKALEECRKEIRQLCHSPRWRAPDYDGPAHKWMEQVAPGEGGDVSPQMRRELRLAHQLNCRDGTDPLIEFVEALTKDACYGVKARKLLRRMRDV